MRLAGKVAFITGGSSGIGLAAVQAFIREGAKVAVTARNLPRLREAVASLGGAVLPLEADAGDDAAMAAATRTTADSFGGIDIVFANAGLYIDVRIGSATREAFDKVFATGAAGVYMTVQAALPHLRDGASVILNGSGYSTQGQPGSAAYAGAKGAVGAMARVMASELSPRGIRVNMVVPGAVETPSWGFDRYSQEEQRRHKTLLGERAPLNRMVTAQEVANVVLFLASDESSGVQAAEIVVDGGATGAVAGSPRFMRGEPQ
jgi:NAD(P)-dependent dehydrogenase (short-subunit alcohol dehydrogenase family)